MSDHWNDLAEKLGTPSLNPLPRKSPSASKPSKSEPEAPQAVQNEEPIQQAPAKAEEVKPAKRSSWDALLGVFGIGGSSEPEAPKQPVAAEAPKAKSSFFAAPEVQPTPEAAPVVDEIGWQAPPRKRGRDNGKETAKPVSNREPEAKAEPREQAPSRDATSREQAPREQAPREPSPRHQNRDHRSRDRRPNAEADAPQEAVAPREKPNAPRDNQPAQRDAGKKDIRPSRDRAGKKTRAPSLWDETAEAVQDESPIIESIDDVDLDVNDNEVVERRGRRRPPRRGHQIRNEDDVRDVVSEPAADIEEPVASDDRPEQRPPRGGRGRGRDNRRDGNRDGGNRDAAARDAMPRDAGRDSARGESSSREATRETPARDSGPRESGPRDNNPRGPRENNRPRRDDRRGAPAGRGHQRAAEPIEDSLDVDSVEEVADTWGLSAEEPAKEEAPTRSRRGNRGRRRGRNADRDALPSDENAELVDGDDLGAPVDDEEGPTRHIKIPTWSEAIGILVELNTENHKKVGNTPQGNRHRGGGGGRRGGGGGYNGGRGRDNNPPR